MTQTFVLVHGAWHGAWCWEAVAAILRARGHRVSTPTQTGLGERAAELSREITLETFIADVTSHLEAQGSDDIILVGHSFAGSSISGAAERNPERIRRLVYLDALIAEAGEAPFDTMPPEVVTSRIALAEKTSGGLSIPPPGAEAFGVLDRAQQAWLEPRLTPHPLGTFHSPLPITGLPGAGLPVDYIMVTAPVYTPLERSRDRAEAYGWPMHTLATGHDAMVSAPQALAEMLIALAEQP